MTELMWGCTFQFSPGFSKYADPVQKRFELKPGGKPPTHARSCLGVTGLFFFFLRQVFEDQQKAQDCFSEQFLDWEVRKTQLFPST